MDDTLRRCLDDLEARIHPQQEAKLLQEWIDFSEGRFTGKVFSPVRASQSAPGVEWPEIRVNETLEDYDRMALQQYGLCSRTLEMGTGHMLNVRSNYGSSILPLLFGVEPFIMDDEFNCLPTSEPLNDIDAIKRLLDAGVPDLNAGFGERTFEMGKRFKAIAAEYPKIGKHVFIYHPDCQGPMDIAEVIWGSTMFYSLYDKPGLVHDLLELVTETYIQFMNKWKAIIPFRQDGNAHWGLYHKGNIMLRDDSAMNLSPEMFEEFIRPYDQRLLDEFGGGAIHFCGKGDHYMPDMPKMPGMYAINMSQPHYNDMETVLANTVDQGINVLMLPPEAATDAVDAGRDLGGRVHSFGTEEMRSTWR